MDKAEEQELASLVTGARGIYNATREEREAAEEVKRKEKIAADEATMKKNREAWKATIKPKLTAAIEDCAKTGTGSVVVLDIEVNITKTLLRTVRLRALQPEETVLGGKKICFCFD